MELKLKFALLKTRGLAITSFSRVHLARAWFRFYMQFGWATWLIVISLGGLLITISLQYQFISKEGIVRRQIAVLSHYEEENNIMRNREALRAFESKLVDLASAPFVIETLLRQASQENLSSQRGAYRLEEPLHSSYSKLYMRIPVKGDAHSVERFINSVLNANEVIALRQLSFKREQATSPIVEADIEWILYCKPKELEVLSTSSSDKE
jgi:hypothetical protein